MANQSLSNNCVNCNANQIASGFNLEFQVQQAKAVLEEYSDISTTDSQSKSLRSILNEVNDHSSKNAEDGNKEKKKVTRKRKRNPAQWKQNVRRKLCESGQPYTDKNGTFKDGKIIQNIKDCYRNCKFKCEVAITNTERQGVHKEFWALCDDQKLNFFNKNVERRQKARERTSNENSVKHFSYFYYFYIRDNKIRVCKKYFLSTLAISQRRISYFFEKKLSEVTKTPIAYRKGKHTKGSIAGEAKDIVKNHIDSFPKIGPHYCRNDTQREYLEASLNLKKMYELYLEHCREQNYENTVKEHLYRQIFNYDFNLSFVVPKKDRCDFCEEHKNKSIAADEANQSENYLKFLLHSQNKNMAREIRNKDREIKTTDIAVVCFDMENVLSLPRANVSSFFYRRKLNTYNLTAHCSVNNTKKCYCILWSEGVSGRTGNDIASALNKILKLIVLDCPSVKTIILWSDSCVPQNRNSIMSLAIKNFLKCNSSVTEIIQKFSEAGHSTIQEVDNIHSQIEKVLCASEVYSPLGLLRILPQVNRRNPFKVYHLQPSDFYQFMTTAQLYNFKNIPYASVKQLKYKKDEPIIVHYNKSYNEDFVAENIIATRKTRSKASSSAEKNCKVITDIVEVKKQIPSKTCLLSKEKVLDLKKMFKFMPAVDKNYIETLLKELK